MIGIAKNDLSLDFVAYISDMTSLHATHCADGHENGCGNVAMVGMQDTRSGFAFQVGSRKGEFHGSIFFAKVKKISIFASSNRGTAVSITFFFNRLSFYVLALFVLTLIVQLCIHWIRFSRLAFTKKHPMKKADDKLEPVSVVVCARDAYHHLVELIPALLSQDYPEFEVVVVNDCSDDETEEYLNDLVRHEAKVKPVQLRQHLNFFNGKKYPLSLGIKSASHDLLILTDPDCTHQQPMATQRSGLLWQRH